MAILASFAVSDRADLSEFLRSVVFADAESVTMAASKEEIDGYKKFLDRYKAGLSEVRKASEEVLQVTISEWL